MLMKPNPLNGSQKGVRLVQLFGHEIQIFVLKMFSVFAGIFVTRQSGICFIFFIHVCDTN